MMPKLQARPLKFCHIPWLANLFIAFIQFDGRYPKEPPSIYTYIKLCKILEYLPGQLLQDFFHQQCLSNLWGIFPACMTSNLQSKKGCNGFTHILRSFWCICFFLCLCRPFENSWRRSWILATFFEMSRSSLELRIVKDKVFVYPVDLVNQCQTRVPVLWFFCYVLHRSYYILLNLPSDTCQVADIINDINASLGFEIISMLLFRFFVYLA